MNDNDLESLKMLIYHKPEDKQLVLPGMEDYAAPPTQPIYSSNKAKQNNSSRDLYNLRLLDGLVAADFRGFPQLKPWTPSAVSQSLVFHEARAYYRRHRRLSGFFVHFYTDDEKFDCVRRQPEKYVGMFKSADFIVAPDFSTYRNYPPPVLVKNAFDNLLLGAYFQKMGCRVLANVIWARPVFYNLTFSGQPVGGTICVSSNSLDIRDKKGIQHWLHGYAEAVKRLLPTQVIRIGKVIPGEEKIFANPVRREVINPYVERMRHGR